MATKAERFRAASERTGAARPSVKGSLRSLPHLRRGPSKRPRGGMKSNESTHAARKAVYALEDSQAESSRPSRKSTRTSSNRAKTDAPLKNRATMRAVSPKARAAHRQAK